MSLPFRSPWCAIVFLPLLAVAPLRADDASTVGRESPAIALWSQPAYAEVSAATDGLGLVACHNHGIAYDLEWKPRDARPDVGAFERPR